MYKSSVTSKGQVTIPKEIREFLDVATGNQIQFDIVDSEKKIVGMQKELSKIECPVCIGAGGFLTKECACFICDQTGWIEKNKDFLTLIFQNSPKYKVRINVITQEFIHNEFKLLPFIKLKLKSDYYPSKLLDLVQDRCQMQLIRENAPRSISDSSKFMTPSDVVLEEMLQLLITDEAKERIRKWFRYEETM